MTEFLSWCNCVGEVFSPDTLTGVASVAAVADDQDGGTPSERCVGQAPGDGISWGAGCCAGAAPRIRIGDFAEDLRFSWGETLPVGGEPQLVEVGESREIRRSIDRMVRSRGLLKWFV